MTQRDTSAEETLARLRELAEQALRAQSTLAKESIELGRATLRGDLDRSSAVRAYVEAVGREGAEYWRSVGALGLEYAGDLLALGSRTGARIVREASAAGRQQPSPRPRQLQVRLRGPVGGRAEEQVTVVNRHQRSRRVELEPSELRDDAGTVVGASLGVEPARVTVPAGGEHAVTLAVDLPADQVRAGARYTGSVQVTGGDEATLEVTVEVEG